MLSTKRTKSSSSRSHQPLSSADTIASNDDILILILLCLPLKSLLKFKTVSKHWLSLITDPGFSPKHDCKTIPGLFVIRRFTGQTKTVYDFINLGPNPCHAPFKSLTFVDDPSGIRILQSCNGLFLCCSFRANPPETCYYIYNPTTKQYTILPRISPGLRGSSFGKILNVSLAFDPSKSPHYKVICIRKCFSYLSNHYQIEIYSSRTGPWRPSGHPFITPTNVNFKNGVFWNGAINWLSNWGDSLYFDVEEERVKDLPMPPVLGDYRMYRYFGESKGHLHLIEVYDSGSLLFDLYEMERDFSGWFVKYRVDLNPIAAAFPEMSRGSGYVDPIDLHSYVFSVLGVIHEDTEDSFMVLHLPNKALRYNFRDHSFRKVHDFPPLGSSIGGDNSLEFGCFDAYQFIESFSCV